MKILSARFVLGLLALCLLDIVTGGEVLAACSGSSPNRIAASASRTDVLDCVNAATSGDTITVPAGSASWSSAISLPSSKDLTINGATVINCTGGRSVSDPLNCTETNNTNITCSHCWVVNLQAIHIISGFTMTGMTDTRAITFTGNYTAGKYFRIHHNRLVASSWSRINVSGNPNDTGRHLSGIFDHNVIVNLSLTGYGAFAQWDESCGDCQDLIWAQQPPLGQSGANVLVVENNHFKPTSNTNVIDGNHGQRTVFRFNRITGSTISDVEWHGMQGDNRGPQMLEAYGNTSTTSSFSGTVFFRGGTGMIFNNARTSGSAALITNDRSELDDQIPVVGQCDGTHPGVDGNTGTRGYPCRDQPGRGQDTVKWTHGVSGGPFGAYAQPSMPVYLWGNTPLGAEVDSPGNVPVHIVANRDFYDHSTATGSPQTVGVRVGTKANMPAGCTTGVGYWVTDEGNWNSYQPVGTSGRFYKCTATNTWTLYYTPHAYPHPWAGGSGGGVDVGTLPAPANLRVVP